MPSRFIPAMLFALSVMIGPTSHFASAADGDERSSNGFAVVELFTSEGCSSCPPVDAALAELQRSAAKHNQRVYALAFHVDYWDYLGWRDPFGSPAYSARQRAYANELHKTQVYTPQAIVNGRKEIVGSDRAKLRAAIDTVLAADPGAAPTIRARIEERGESRVRIGFEVGEAAPSDVLHIAIVEDALESKVTRGENRGRTLAHAGVVRAFHTVALKNATKGAVTLDLVKGVKPEHARVFCYVQRGPVGPIRAASEVGGSLAGQQLRRRTESDGR